MSARETGGMDRESSAATTPNWVVREATNADPRQDRIVLENPMAVAALDEILVNRYIPFIRAELEKTGYPYRPRDLTSTIESTADGPRLARKLTFMLFDEGDFLFLRCSVSCSKMGYMVKKEFYLDLPESTDKKLLLHLLGDPHFAGNPPSLMVQRHALRPEWGTFFWIKFEAGDGFISGPWELHGEALADIGRTIQDACEMYEASMVEGLKSLDDADRFLEVASRSFESS